VLSAHLLKPRVGMRDLFECAGTKQCEPL
jgi:hypothetical protein